MAIETVNGALGFLRQTEFFLTRNKVMHILYEILYENVL